MLKTKRRRLFIDIETSPNIGLFWQAGYKQRIDYSNIIKERQIICICYKWEDEKEVYSLDWGKKQCDKKLLTDFIQIANQADELVAHNGDKFDLPWIRGRCVYHQIDMFPTYSSIDTLKISRNKFRFNSNRLDYIAKYLGIGGKIKTEFNLWKDIVLDHSEKALQDMIKYCKRDVVLLEKVYNRIKSHSEPKMHYGVIFGQDRTSCRECGCDELVKIKTRTTATGLKKSIFKCKECGTTQTKTDK